MVQEISMMKNQILKSKNFWSNIWDNEKEHERIAEWLRELKDNMKKSNTITTTEMITKQVKKIPNWKSPGRDGVQGYWLKKLTALHEQIAKQMDNIISNREDIPKWVTLAKMVLCQKDPSKGNAVDNYRPISCLPSMWKLMIRTIAESVYNFLDVNNKLPVEKKDTRRKVEGPKISYSLIRQ